MSNYLKDKLKEKNMTQKELSIRTGITEAGISRYCNGTRKPRVEAIFYMARALGVDYIELMKGIWGIEDE